MKKFLVVSVVTLLFMLCTGYTQLSTVFCATINGNEALRRCSLTQTPPSTLITPAENIYAHHAGSRLYRSVNSPINNTVAGGGGRIIQR